MQSCSSSIMLIGLWSDLTTFKPFGQYLKIPKIHIKCEVHEFVTYFPDREDIEGDMDRHWGTSIVGSNSSIIANLKFNERSK